MHYVAVLSSKVDFQKLSHPDDGLLVSLQLSGSWIMRVAGWVMECKLRFTCSAVRAMKIGLPASKITSSI